MSHFRCEHCGAACTDTPRGYITGCEHYPAEKWQTRCYQCGKTVPLGTMTAVEGVGTKLVCRECGESVNETTDS